MRLGSRYLWILIAAVLTASLLPSGLRASPPSKLVFADLFMPLVFRSVALAELPTPPPGMTLTPTLPPTVTEPPTATPTPTDTPTPTVTNTPPPTPTFVAGGSIGGRLLVDDQPAQIGLGLGIGPAIYLRRCTVADECENVDRTAVEDEAGRYVFREPAPLAPGTYYQVVWYNEINPPVMLGDDIWLGSWYGPRITELKGGEEVQGGDLEVADLKLTTPTHGTGFSGLPILFKWQARPKEVGSYRWGICECCQNLAQRTDAWLTASLGARTEYEMSFYPPNTRVGNEYRYCWFVRIQTQEGYGESFHIRMLWFFLMDFWRPLSQLGLIDLADWVGGPPLPPTRGPWLWSE